MAKGTILFVHGSSMASQPTFDLQELAAFMRAEYDKWGKVVCATGATVN